MHFVFAPDGEQLVQELHRMARTLGVVAVSRHGFGPSDRAATIA
jgi:hypothetical protein